MTNIKIIRKQDGYAYKYEMIYKDKRHIYITKSGYKTQKDALEAAKKSYNNRMRKEYSKPIKKKQKNIKFPKIKKLEITTNSSEILTLVLAGGVGITLIAGISKLSNDIKIRFPEIPTRRITDEIETTQREINISDCDFSNLHVVLRTAKEETNGVAIVTSDQLTRLGISNEIISGDSNLANKIETAINEHTNCNVILINLETELENYNTDRTLLMGDSSNLREYSSDVLLSCIDTSLREYNLDGSILSGESTGEGWRLASYIETELANASLINKISQFTIDLPITIYEDNIVRNDAASSIVEGIIRWTALEPYERYNNIYYTAKYGDTVVSVASELGLSSIDIQNNSDISEYRQITVGDTLMIGATPRTAIDNVTVNNPYTTTNINEIEPEVNTYTVQSGDTLTRIANAYGVKVDDIITSSGDPNNITAGETLFITTYNLYETHEKINLLEENNQNQM